MFSKDALEYLMSLGEVELIECDEVDYSTKPLHQIKEVSPSVFSTKTLISLVELIKRENEHPRLNNLIIHVENPVTVHVYSGLREQLNRFHLYTATSELPHIQFERFLGLEEMLIMLKSSFVESETRDNLIALLGSIREENVRTSSDDGISQTVTAKTGIAALGNVVLPPVVALAPYRTFVEVPQPEGEFLLRLRNGPEVALFEADGGAWKLAARRNIKKFFKGQLGDLIEDGRIVITE